MFVAAYDDRPIMPDYFIPFIRNTTAFCDLYLITPAKGLPENCELDLSSCQFGFHIINPASLPVYGYVKQLFDDVFVNYSTNPDSFERACFHRWFAINAATTFLSANDYICLLDTDFLIGMEPSDVLSECLLRAEEKDIQCIAEWDGEEPIAMGPEITIMTKLFLFGFCDYLLTTYFSPFMRSQLLREYFERIGNGLSGGICDMRALAAYSRLSYNKIFNLMKLDSLEMIRSFNSFLNSEVGKTGNWKILFQSHKQILQIAEESRPLIGTHFQGSAKAYMLLLEYGESSTDTELSQDICTEYLDLLAAVAQFQNVANYEVG